MKMQKTTKQKKTIIRVGTRNGKRRRQQRNKEQSKK